MMGVLFSLGGLALAILGFLLGRVFNQSELILTDKRRIYEEFLKACPQPSNLGEKCGNDPMAQISKIQGPLTLYAAPGVASAVAQYINALGKLIESIETEPLGPAFMKAAKAHNDIVLEMRRDAFAWSAFAYRGPSRLSDEVVAELGKPKR